MDETTRLLKEGIQAIKAGRREEAKTLLLRVIELDEENERAWLWLSGAVETDEDRRICLENVLQINPNNELAQKGLARLKPAAADEIELPPSFMAEDAAESIPEQISEVSLPPSLMARAAQVAQPPEPEEERGWWVDKPVVEAPATAQMPKYNDVWSRGDEICAFCAEPVIRTQNRCPQCNRPLVAKALINAIPGKYYNRLLTWLIVYLVLRLLGIVLIVAFLADASIPGVDYAAVLTESIASFVPFAIATYGIFQREAWAYWLLLIAAILETGLMVVLAFSAGNFGVLLCMSPLLALSVFILFTIYMAGEDFQKQQVRRIAVVSDRLKEPAALDRVAQKLAKEGKWASAVLHWQRAVGRASGHTPYLLRLGHAFAELGFYERSMDILNTALEAARNSQMRQEVEQEMVRVTRLRQEKKVIT